jgi:K+ transporter
MEYTNLLVPGSAVFIIGVIILLLLIIIGIVTFNAYMFVIADNGFRMGAGGDFSLFANQNKRQKRRMNYRRRNYGQNDQSIASQQAEQSVY